MYAYG